MYFSNKANGTNPFPQNGKQGESRVELVIADSAEYKETTCKNFYFCFKVSKQSDGWQFRAMDYVEYNAALGRQVVYTGDIKDYEEAKETYRGHSVCDPFLRPYEPAVLVHSTTPNGYTQIIKDGALKSWNRIKNENRIGEENPIGRLLGDPEDFREYVMLGGLGFWSEIVVSSKQKGYICMDADCEYTAGARFYFDALTLIKENLLVRDGMHYKVKGELPLRYALFCAAAGNIIISGKITPRAFASAADEAFAQTEKAANLFSYRQK
jgi:hypothetical protein